MDETTNAINTLKGFITSPIANNDAPRGYRDTAQDLESDLVDLLDIINRSILGPDIAEKSPEANQALQRLFSKELLDGLGSVIKAYGDYQAERNRMQGAGGPNSRRIL